MQHLDQIADSGRVEMHSFSDSPEEAESLVIFELVVPVAAKVPAPSVHLEMAKMVVRQASITSTVPTELRMQLCANNTAQGAAWCITATLATPRRPRRSPRF